MQATNNLWNMIFLLAFTTIQVFPQLAYWYEVLLVIADFPYFKTFSKCFLISVAIKMLSHFSCDFPQEMRRIVQEYVYSMYRKFFYISTLYTKIFHTMFYAKQFYVVFCSAIQCNAFEPWTTGTYFTVLCNKVSTCMYRT